MDAREQRPPASTEGGGATRGFIVSSERWEGAGLGAGETAGLATAPPGAKRFVKSELKNTVILQTEPQIQVPIVLKKPLQRT